MCYRLQLAALHYNENSTRPQATTMEGEARYKMYFPKFKHGEHVVRKVKEDASFGMTNHAITNAITSTFT